jgi:hypothetical protein
MSSQVVVLNFSQVRYSNSHVTKSMVLDTSTAFKLKHIITNNYLL